MTNGSHHDRAAADRDGPAEVVIISAIGRGQFRLLYPRVYHHRISRTPVFHPEKQALTPQFQPTPQLPSCSIAGTQAGVA